MKLLVKNGFYEVAYVGSNGKPRAKVFSCNWKFNKFEGEYFDIYCIKKNPYVKDIKGRKYFLKNAEVSSDGSTLYV